MTIDDTMIVSAGAAVWAATSAIVGVLWNRIRTLEKTVARLQAEKAEGDAAKVMIDSCPSQSCPFAGAVGLLLCLSLVSCAPRTAEAGHFDKRILIVVKTEQPPSSAVGSMIKPLLNFLLP